MTHIVGAAMSVGSGIAQASSAESDISDITPAASPMRSGRGSSGAADTPPLPPVAGDWLSSSKDAATGHGSRMQARDQGVPMTGGSHAGPLVQPIPPAARLPLCRSPAMARVCSSSSNSSSPTANHLWRLAPPLLSPALGYMHQQHLQAVDEEGPDAAASATAPRGQGQQHQQQQASGTYSR